MLWWPAGTQVLSKCYGQAAWVVKQHQVLVHHQCSSILLLFVFSCQLSLCLNVLDWFGKEMALVGFYFMCVYTSLCLHFSYFLPPFLFFPLLYNFPAYSPNPITQEQRIQRCFEHRWSGKEKKSCEISLISHLFIISDISAILHKAHVLFLFFTGTICGTYTSSNLIVTFSESSIFILGCLVF